MLDPEDVYCLRASGGETEVRLRSRTPLVDVRPIGEPAPLFGLQSSAGTFTAPRRPRHETRWEVRINGTVTRSLPDSPEEPAGVERRF